MLRSATFRSFLSSTRVFSTQATGRADYLPQILTLHARNRRFSASRCIRNEAVVPTSLDAFTEEENMLREAGMLP